MTSCFTRSARSGAFALAVVALAGVSVAPAWSQGDDELEAPATIDDEGVLDCSGRDGRGAVSGDAEDGQDGGDCGSDEADETTNDS